AGIAPYAETAVGTLQFDNVADRAVERLHRRRPRVGAPQSRDFLDVEQRQVPARCLLETAICIALQRPQQAGNVPIGPWTTAQQGLGGAWENLIRRTIVERDTLARLQPPDKPAQLIGLRRPDRDGEVALDLRPTWSRELQSQICRPGRRG